MNFKAPRAGRSTNSRNLGRNRIATIALVFCWLWIPLLFFYLGKVLTGHMVDTIAAIVFWAWVIFVLVAGVGIFIGEGLEGVRIRRHHVGKGARARIKSWWEETLTDFNDASERRFPVMVFGLFAIPVLGFEAKSSFSFNPFVTLMLLLCCLGIAFLIKEILSLDRKLLSARRVLLDVTFHECHCNPDAKTVPFNHGDAIREARVFLEEQFPGAIEQEIHGYE